MSVRDGVDVSDGRGASGASSVVKVDRCRDRLCRSDRVRHLWHASGNGNDSEFDARLDVGAALFISCQAEWRERKSGQASETCGEKKGRGPNGK